MIVANVFHAGDGNLHPLVCYDGRKEGDAEKAEELSGLIIDACLDAGGSITGEHGVGIDKKKHMPKMFAEEDLDAFQRLRCSFDPAGLANPGKLMPTPRLCGEVPGPLPGASAGGRRAGGAVLRPATVAEAATLLKGLERPIRPVGGGTKPWLPARDEEPLETGGLDRILEHNVGDFTAVLEAGVPFAEAQATFAEHGQRLAWDPPDPGGATIGGIVATADSGPLRHRYGGVRDLVVGTSVVLSDGTIAKSGGKVIKNVAGYDLAKLFAGSFGTLGLIATVSVRLHPLPDEDRDGRVRSSTIPTRCWRRRSSWRGCRWRPTASTSSGSDGARAAAGRSSRAPPPRRPRERVGRARRRRLGRRARAAARPGRAEGVRPPDRPAGR